MVAISSTLPGSRHIEIVPFSFAFSKWRQAFAKMSKARHNGAPSSEESFGGQLAAGPVAWYTREFRQVNATFFRREQRSYGAGAATRPILRTFGRTVSCPGCAHKLLTSAIWGFVPLSYPTLRLSVTAVCVPKLAHFDAHCIEKQFCFSSLMLRDSLDSKYPRTVPRARLLSTLQSNSSLLGHVQVQCSELPNKCLKLRRL